MSVPVTVTCQASQPETLAITAASPTLSVAPGASVTTLISTTTQQNVTNVVYAQQAAVSGTNQAMITSAKVDPNTHILKVTAASNATPGTNTGI